jgi:archaellin
MYLVGSIYGTTADPSGTATLNFLEFKLGVPEGGQAQDMKDLRLLFSKRDGLPIDLKNTVAMTNSTTPGTADGWIFKKDDGDWSYWNDAATPAAAMSIEGGTASSSKIQSGEKMSIRVLLGDTIGPRGGESFTLEVKPRIGASYLITKTLATGYTHGPIL